MALTKANAIVIDVASVSDLLTGTLDGQSIKQYIDTAIAGLGSGSTYDVGTDGGDIYEQGTEKLRIGLDISQEFFFKTDNAGSDLSIGVERLGLNDYTGHIYSGGAKEDLLHTGDIGAGNGNEILNVTTADASYLNLTNDLGDVSNAENARINLGVQYATNAEAINPAVTDKVITPSNLEIAVPELLPDATISQKGKVQLATGSTDISNSTLAVTPNVAALIADGRISSSALTVKAMGRIVDGALAWGVNVNSVAFSTQDAGQTGNFDIVFDVTTSGIGQNLTSGNTIVVASNLAGDDYTTFFGVTDVDEIRIQARTVDAVAITDDIVFVVYVN